jgi:5-methylcytosine-specific restriction endonuclease McrA
VKYATCHPTRKYHARDLCRECYMQAWRAAHPGYNEAHYAANAVNAKERARKWKQSNPERARVNMRRWQDANRDKVRAKNRAEKAQRRASCVASTPHPATTAQRAELVAPGVLCFYCESTQAEHVDHFIPIAKWRRATLTPQRRADGPDHITNLVGACAACNLSKGDRLPDVEWRGRERKSA